MIKHLFERKMIVILIILLGFILRIAWFDSSPPSLYGDELTIALDANSLLRLGTDQLGNSFPLTFQMGAGRPAGYVYGSILFVALFGSTALGVRGLSILSGVVLILLLYLIGRKMFSQEVGMAAAFTTSVSIWDISLSRGGFEAHFALLLAVAGIYFFIKAKDIPSLYILSALSFGLTLHTYPTYKVILPLFLPLLLWYQGFKKTFTHKRKYFLTGLAILVILGFIALSQTYLAGSETRFSEINVFSRDNVRGRIEQKIINERNISTLHQIAVKLFHNKPLEYAKIIIENYLQNFSIDFLILHGDGNPRHNMATMGSLYLAEMAFIIAGILNLWLKQRRALLFILLWIFIVPIPASITDLPHALRVSFMMPALILLAAIGIVTVFKNSRKLLFILTLTFIIQFIFFIQKLYFLAPHEYSRFWSYPARIASEQAIEYKEKVDHVIISDKIDNIEYAYPVYGKVEPSVVITQNHNKIQIGEYNFKQFNNVYIGRIPQEKLSQFIGNLKGSLVYIGLPDDKENLANYEIINGKDGQPALIVKKIYK